MKDGLIGSPRITALIRRLTILGFGVALSMLALGAVMLAGSHSDVRREAESAVANLAVALERDVNRNIMSLDLSVQGAMEALRLPGINEVSPAIRHTALFDRAATAEYLGSILVLTPTGRVAASSTAASAVPGDLLLADRDYFQVQRDRRDAGLFVSKPYNSRLRAGDASIAISRRLENSGGEFAGVVLGALRIAYFQHLFETLNLGPRGVVSLVRTDGILIVRHPAANTEPGRDTSQSTGFKRMGALRSGSYVDRSSVDGAERLVAFRRIGDLPLLLTVGMATGDIYAAWWRKAIVIAAVLSALSLGTASLCLLFRREMLRRLAVQRQLQDTADQLRVMAATDSLTGLANRRAFETELNQEWRRAIRNDAELALLMLDADQFKAYNDLYGHPAGDRALRRMAEVIQSNISRPSDMAARVGGEEFMVLLPDTSLDGALLVADRMRVALREAAIAHAGGESGRMTFSIGAATARPAAGEEEGRLLKRVDDAMYRAKHAGRDRVVAATADPGDAPDLPSLHQAELGQ